MSFFVSLGTCGSLSGAAREPGISTAAVSKPAAVSKRLSQMESRLGVPLVNRTTRRMSLTPDGEVLLEHARRILGEIAALDQLLSASQEMVKVLGNLTTNDGEIAVNRALDGHGILMRAEWDIERYLESRRLVQV